MNRQRVPLTVADLNQSIDFCRKASRCDPAGEAERNSICGLTTHQPKDCAADGGGGEP